MGSAGMSLKIMTYIGIGGLILWLIGHSKGDYRLFAGYVLVVMVSYVISLYAHPLRECWYCQGGGKHFGWIWSYGSRICTHCDGKARIPRLGVRLLGIPHEGWRARHK